MDLEESKADWDGIASFEAIFSSKLISLKKIWEKQGFYHELEGEVLEKDWGRKKLEALLGFFEGINMKEARANEIMLSEINDILLNIEESCIILARPSDDYLLQPWDQIFNLTYQALNKAKKNLSILTEEISSRRNKVQEACSKIKLLCEELTIQAFEFDLATLDSDLSYSVMNPVLRKLDLLTVERQNLVNQFNVSVSYIHYKWNTLALEPEVKDEVDILLTQLFNLTPMNPIKPSPKYPGMPNLPFEAPVYDFYSTAKQNKLPFSLDRSQLSTYFARSQLTTENISESFSKDDLLVGLARLYKLCDITPDPKHITDVKGNVTMKKLKEQHGKLNSYLETNMTMLTSLHFQRLAKLWTYTHVSQEVKDDYQEWLKECETPRIALEMIVDDYDNLKYQFDQAPDIFSKIQKRKYIIDKLREFEANKSVDRFKGSSIKLLREEEFRKHEYPQLIVLENKLLKMVEKFELKQQRPFLYEGGRFLHILRKSIERRSGNLEIIGLKDPMSTESFSSKYSHRQRIVNANATASASTNATTGTTQRSPSAVPFNSTGSNTSSGRVSRTNVSNGNTNISGRVSRANTASRSGRSSTLGLSRTSNTDVNGVKSPVQSSTTQRRLSNAKSPPTNGTSLKSASFTIDNELNHSELKNLITRRSVAPPPNKSEGKDGKAIPANTMTKAKSIGGTSTKPDRTMATTRANGLKDKAQPPRANDLALKTDLKRVVNVKSNVIASRLNSTKERVKIVP